VFTAIAFQSEITFGSLAGGFAEAVSLVAPTTARMSRNAAARLHSRRPARRERSPDCAED
jgi:hypothetical protein